MDDSTTTEVAAPAAVPTAPTEAKKAFLAALAKAQGEFLPIVRNREVSIKSDKGNYSFKYAELSEIIDKTRPALSKNGLSLRSSVLPHREPGHVWLQSILAHADGHEDVVEIAIHVAGDMKLFGGQLSYLRRYLSSGQLGIASEDDDEAATQAGTGNVGGGRPPAPAPRPRPQPAPARAPAEPPADAERSVPDEADAAAAPAAPNGATIGEGQVKWLKNKLAAVFPEPGARAGFVEQHAPGVGAKLEEITEAQFAAMRSDLNTR